MFFFSSRRRHTRSLCDWSSDVCSSDLMDITTTSAGTSEAVAFQVGKDYHWCQTSFGYIQPNTSTTITVDLGTLLTSTAACLGSLPVDTTVLQGMWVYFSGGGIYYLDNLRTQ